jgi:hypothetical protein
MVIVFKKKLYIYIIIFKKNLEQIDQVLLTTMGDFLPFFFEGATTFVKSN